MDLGAFAIFLLAAFASGLLYFVLRFLQQLKTPPE